MSRNCLVPTHKGLLFNFAAKKYVCMICDKVASTLSIMRVLFSPSSAHAQAHFLKSHRADALDWAKTAGEGDMGFSGGPDMLMQMLYEMAAVDDFFSGGEFLRCRSSAHQSVT